MLAEPDCQSTSAEVSSLIRVMVVDDSAIARGLIVQMLERHAPITVVARAANGEAALAELNRTSVDVVILDLEMPVMDGMTALPLMGDRARIAQDAHGGRGQRPLIPAGLGSQKVRLAEFIRPTLASSTYRASMPRWHPGRWMRPARQKRRLSCEQSGRLLRDPGP